MYISLDSGHAFQKVNSDLTEEDGLDECITPCDGEERAIQDDVSICGWIVTYILLLSLRPLYRNFVSTLWISCPLEAISLCVFTSLSWTFPHYFR